MSNKRSKACDVIAYNTAESELWIELNMYDMVDYERVEMLKGMLISYNESLDIPNEHHFTNAYQFASGKSNSVDFNYDFEPIVKYKRISGYKKVPYTAEYLINRTKETVKLRWEGVYNSDSKESYKLATSGDLFHPFYQEKQINKHRLIVM